MRRIAIVGGGIAGVTAAWQLAKLAADGARVEAVLFEASSRLGGIVETVRRDGFIIECGPDAWVTEKPWARNLAEELGLAGEIIPSNDDTRKTYVLEGGKLVAMPDRMRMMVPVDLDVLNASPLFSAAAKAAYRAEPGRAEELKAAAPEQDESVASFVERHFGAEVVAKVGAPLLGGVFGGDVNTLSVRAVMAPFVEMEREHGSLIVALQQRAKSLPSRPVFTTLRNGTGTLIERMAAAIPRGWIKLDEPVLSLQRIAAGWKIFSSGGQHDFDHLLLAVPADTARRLLQETDPLASELMRMEASSAVVAALGFSEPFPLPPGFGFLVPPGTEGSRLLAGTFVDQKFESRVPCGSRLLRGYFGGAVADELLEQSDAEIVLLAMRELRAVLGELPEPALSVVRRWPGALPQYAVGHGERMARLADRVKGVGALSLLGNGYRGVGLPDLVRDGRAAACDALNYGQDT